jgi:hypothetical protein
MSFLYALPNSSTESLQQNYTVSKFSYVIFRDETKYYARNSISNIVEFEGTNVTRVLTQTSNSLTHGGKILIAQGEYELSGEWIINNEDIIIEGEGFSTVLKNFGIRIAEKKCRNQIRDIKIDIVDRSRNGITCINSEPWTSNLDIYNVYITNADFGIYLENASDCRILKSNIGLCNTGIYAKVHFFLTIENTFVYHCTIREIYAKAWLSMKGCVVPSKALSEALLLDNSQGEIAGCWFETDKATPLINMENCASLHIAGCEFAANTSGDLIKVKCMGFFIAACRFEYGTIGIHVLSGWGTISSCTTVNVPTLYKCENGTTLHVIDNSPYGHD